LKKILTLTIIFSSLIASSQGVQNLAPWMQDQTLKNKSKVTLEEISKSAENYFKTIDRSKKGSGLKPFERWKYQWSFYTKEDGTIAPASDLWKAWEQKNEMNRIQSKADVSDWTPLGPFQSSNTYSSATKKSSGQGRVNVIAVDPSNPNTYYIGAPAGGIWKSTDAGLNWQPLTDYLPQIGVSGIAIHPSNSDIIYIATGDDDAGDSYSVGVWKTIDGGTTWAATGSMIGNPNSMNEIYIDTNNPDTVLVATNSGVHKTTDGGTTWSRKLVGNIIDLKVKPNDFSIWYAVSSNTFYRSTDSGENFSTINLPGLIGSGRLTMDVTIADDNYVYVVSSKTGAGSFAFNGIYKSIDSGASFTKTSETSDIFGTTQAWYDLALTVSSVDKNIIYVGVLDIWKSTDGGEDFTKLTTWFQPDTPSFTHADIHFLRFIDGKFFAGTDGGIYVSTNEGVNFTDLTEKLSISQFYKISASVQNSSVIAGGLQDNGGFAYNETSWTNYHGGDGMEGNVSPINENIHYGFTQYGGSLNRTSNKGATSDLRVDAPFAESIGDNGGEWVTPMTLNNAGEVYAGYKELYKLEGNSWTKLSNQSFSDDLDRIEIDPNNNDNIYVSESNRLYKSTDGGVTFNQIVFSQGTINAIEVSNLDSNTAWIGVNTGVYKTTNLTSETPTFINLTDNLPSENKLTIKHHSRSGNNTIYLGTTLGVYSYNDSSDAWEVFDNNLPNVAIRDLEINEKDSKLYAGTYGRGVFITNIPRISPPVDISLVSISSPSNSPGELTCSNSNISPILKVKNEGTDALTSVTINYTLDAGTSNSYTWNGGPLNSEEDVNITIPGINISMGIHTLNFEIEDINDAYITNNSASTTFLINNTNDAPTTINSFETSEDELLVETFGGNGWEIATPNKTLLNTAATGTRAYITNASGNYPDQTTSYLYSKCYDLSSVTSPILSFKMGFDIETNWDYLQVEYTTNSGNNWTTLGSASDPNWYNSNSTANGIPGAQWTGLGEDSNNLGGTNATLHDYSFDLADLSSETNIIFRFKFITDQAVNEEGVVIDDFVVNGVLSIINEAFQNSFLIYPNPSEGIFNLSWSEDGTANVSVYNYLGKTILQQKNIQNKSYQVHLENRSKGLYFIKINIDGKQAIKKVILK
jgi:photosystem II stability/assembly factor-like uncharacterized protein